MSKSYTVNGRNMLYKCLDKATENVADITIELNNLTLSKMLGIIAHLSNYKKLTVLYNLNPDEEFRVGNYGEVIRQKDKIDLLERKLKSEICTIGITSDLANWITKIDADYSNLRILVSTKVTKHTNLCICKYSSGDVRTILFDIDSDDNEICSVTSYLPGEDIENSLENCLNSSINSSGRNCANEIVKLTRENISINTRTNNEMFNRVLYDINKHHINSYIKQKSMLSSLNKAELQFQSDGVDSLITILLKYGIAYLADSVGLGKTIISLRLLAKTGYNALVITPSEIVANQWKEYIYEPNEVFEDDVNIHFCINSYQDLERFAKLDKDYDIVIFDEAQNFRNMNTLRYKKAQELCAGKQVLLIGATPINNNIADLEAQLMLGLNPSLAYDFEVGLIGDFFESLRKMTNKSKKNTTEYKKAQKLAGSRVRKAIISKIMVRRTRSDIEKYYQNDINSGRLHFPTVHTPEIIRYKYNGTKLANTLDILSGYNYRLKLTYALYNPSRYLKHKKKNVENPVDNVENSELLESDENLRELNMTGLTKVRLIKLLDSSPEAFLNSLHNMILNIEDRINYLQGYISDSDYEQLRLDSYDKESSDESEFTVNNPEIYTDQYIADLENDKAVLLEIMSYWYKDGTVVDSDVKVNELHKILENNQGKKCVIFTEFLITAETLSKKLEKLGYKVLKIDGSDSKTKTRELMDNFSLSGRMRDDYDILVSTNVLSEGINMNRASIAVNYDITWNPMIITQRVGRLNRIDSIIHDIYVYNFFPCDEMDTAILSESNIISKYTLASYSIGTDENYLIDNDKESDISMMEFKESIINNISQSISDEQLDFKTVDFRFSALANSVFSTQESIDNLPDEVIIKTIKGHQNEVRGTIGVFNYNGRILTCKIDSTGFYYIGYNDLLQQLQNHKDEANYFANINFYNLCSLYNYAKSNIIGTQLKSDEQRKFYMVLCRLQNNLDRSLEMQDINEIEYNRIYDKISNIKDNIINGLINDYLCKAYNQDFTERTRKDNMSTLEQCRSLLDLIPDRFIGIHKNSLKYNIKIIAILEITN